LVQHINASGLNDIVVDYWSKPNLLKGKKKHIFSMAHTISYTFAYTFTYANNIYAHMVAVGI